jgi:adenylate cyclase
MLASRLPGRPLTMAQQNVQRRLAAILAADVLGYSRLMSAGEKGTSAALNVRRRNIRQPMRKR